MKKPPSLLPLSLSLLIIAIGGGALFAQEANPGTDDKNVSFALSMAAAELDWIGKVETADLPSNAKMFLIRDSKGLLAITRYADPGAAEKAFAASSGGATESTFHGFPAYRRSSGGSLTWLAEAFVFSVGSGSGEAEKIGDSLAKAAVGSALVKNPEKVAPDVDSDGRPMVTEEKPGNPGTPENDPIAPPQPEPGQFLAGGDFEDGIPLDRGRGTLARDPTDPGNFVLAMTQDDSFEQALTIPDDVDSLKVSFRAWVPPSIQLESFEPGRPAPGVRISMRTFDSTGEARISTWLLQPGNEWQELSMRATEIGSCREKFTLEASQFSGMIYVDDIEITSLFPEFLSEEMYEHYRTPAQVTYFYVVNPLFSGERVTRVGSPVITDRKVTIDFDFDGGREILWFVEKENDGETAQVVVGPPNAGGDLYRLQKIEGRWAISGIEPSDGI